MQNDNNKKIKVQLKSLNKQIEVDAGTPFQEVIDKYGDPKKPSIVAVRENQELKELFKTFKVDCDLEFVDLCSADGIRIYERTLIFLLDIAIKTTLGKDKNLVIYHSLGNGLYCEIEGHKITTEELKNIDHTMQSMIALNIPIMKKPYSKAIALKKFQKANMLEKVGLLQFRRKNTVNIYHLNNYINYFYGYMVPSTGYLKSYKLQKDEEGIVLIVPNTKSNQLPTYKPQPKLSHIFIEHKKWAKILGVKYVSDLNNTILRGDEHTSELIKLSEALQEKKIAQIADKIKSRNNVKLALIAGPTSSGKTSFSKRLSLQLKINGLNPKTISLDNYFCDRELSPKDEFGQYDFENIDSLKIDLLNEHLTMLLDGQTITLPRYDFKAGKGVPSDNHMKLGEDDILIVEGIHGLNESLTSKIPRDSKYKIYTNALTQIDLDPLNRIHTTDTRIIRRIVRDYRYRGTSAAGTLEVWRNVRKGEYRNIFPFQEEADSVFNSSLVYELAILKLYAEPLLAAITPDHEFYEEAKRLVRFLDFFLPITNSHEVPGTSILREFIGGSYFKY